MIKFVFCDIIQMMRKFWNILVIQGGFFSLRQLGVRKRAKIFMKRWYFMKKTIKRLAAIGLAALMTAGALSSCSGGNSSSGTDSKKRATLLKERFIIWTLNPSRIRLGRSSRKSTQRKQESRFPFRQPLRVHTSRRLPQRWTRTKLLPYSRLTAP